MAEALKKRGVICLIDVRSIPASAYRPEYNRAALEAFLKKEEIAYRHMPGAFGARQEKKGFLSKDGRVDFERVSASEEFEEGVMQTLGEMESGVRFALMCAEKDPAFCHRTVLIGRKFQSMGVQVIHIHPDGDMTQRDVEARLLDMYFPNRFQLSLLEEMRTEEELLSEAYRKQGEKIAFRKEE